MHEVDFSIYKTFKWNLKSLFVLTATAWCCLLKFCKLKEHWLNCTENMLAIYKCPCSHLTTHSDRLGQCADVLLSDRWWCKQLVAMWWYCFSSSCMTHHQTNCPLSADKRSIYSTCYLFFFFLFTYDCSLSLSFFFLSRLQSHFHCAVKQSSRNALDISKWAITDLGVLIQWDHW